MTSSYISTRSAQELETRIAFAKRMLEYESFSLGAGLMKVGHETELNLRIKRNLVEERRNLIRRSINLWFEER
jgi:hypothetical protein